MEDALIELARVLGLLERTRREAVREIREGLARMLGIDDNVLLRKLYELKNMSPDYDKMRRELYRMLGGNPEELGDKGLLDALPGLLGREEKVMVGVIGSPFTEPGRQCLRALETLRSMDLPDNVVVEDFSTNVLTVADLINEYKPDLLVIVSAATRGRRPGIHVEELGLERKNDAFEMLDDARASLDGWIDTDAVVRGLPLFLEHRPRRAVLVECEPMEEDCSSLLVEEALRQAGIRVEGPGSRAG